MSENTTSGVEVDTDAVRKHDPVTVLVSPAGNEYDADTWSDANNLLGAGYAVKDGYPTGPGEQPAASSPEASAQPAESTAPEQPAPSRRPRSTAAASDAAGDTHTPT